MRKGRRGMGVLALVGVAASLAGAGCGPEPVQGQTCPGGPLPGTAYIERPELVAWTDDACGGLDWFEGVGDFDGDGRLDLLGLGIETVWCPGPGEPGHGCQDDLRVCVGNLEGPAVQVAYVDVVNIYTIDSEAPGDLDGDGFGDVLFRAPNYLSEATQVIRGSAEPSALNVLEPSPLTTRDLPRFADNFTGSGVTALVLLSAGELRVDTLDPDAEGVTRHTTITGLSGQPSFAPVGDIDDDGRDDIAVLHESGSGWVLHGGEPLELDQTQLPSARTSAFEFPGAYLIEEAGDFNGDGVSDLALAVERGEDDHRVYVVFGGARGPLPSAAELEAGSGGLVVYGVRKIVELEAIGDFSGDGLDDLAIATSDAIHLAFGRAQTDGEDMAEIARGCAWGRSFSIWDGRPRWTGDLDGDGRDDLGMFGGVLLTSKLD